MTLALHLPLCFSLPLPGCLFGLVLVAAEGVEREFLIVNKIDRQSLR